MGLLYKPDFIVAGPPKTGTSWLYSQLQHVSGIDLPPVKEISFFNEVYIDFILRPENETLLNEYRLMGHEINPAGAIWARQNAKNRRERNYQHARSEHRRLWGLYYRAIPRNVSKLAFSLYSRLFKQDRNVVSFDISPLYFTLGPQILQMMAERFSGLKVFFILRDPVEREWSNIRMNYFGSNVQQTFSIDEYLAKRSFNGDYIRNLGNWEKHFDKKRINYLFYDDLKSNPEKFTRDFVSLVKPAATISKFIVDPVGKGVEKPLDTEIKQALLKVNIAQYDFLAEKFGSESYPAKWREKALSEKY